MSHDSGTSARAISTTQSGIPGKYVVLTMFALGALSTATIFLYWDLHTAPFRPLTEALGREFPRSLPKVEGGSHKGGPATLRIAIRVPFEPQPENQESQEVVNRVIQVARAQTDLKKFSLVQVHLFQLAPERIAKQASFEYPSESLTQGALPFPDLPQESAGSGD